MSLDCLTPRGRRWVAHQKETARALADRWGVSVVETPDGTPAAVDALFVREGVLIGVAEIKCRTLSLAQLRGYGDYLITEEKLRAGCALSQSLCVPFLTCNGGTAIRTNAYLPLTDIGRIVLAPAP